MEFIAELFNESAFVEMSPSLTMIVVSSAIGKEWTA
jgi:hypothetical protein